MAGTILVTGATGTIGGEVTRQLIAAGVRPRILVRDPAKAKAFEGKADIAQGDFTDAASLDRALKGVEKLFLAYSGPNQTEVESKVVDAAKQAGVKHVVKLSVFGADTGALTFARWHRPVEQRLEQSGMQWTHLRPLNFMTNTFGFIETIKSQGAFYAPTGEGKTSFIDPEDIAAVAVKALTQPGHEGKAYLLTGPEALSGADQAAHLSKALGKPVKFVDVPPDAARQSLSNLPLPPGTLDALLDLMSGMKRGLASEVTPTVEQVLGRKPRTFADWCQRNAAAFR